MNATIFSFIIPHKDSLNELFRCLKSIPNRKDIEVIVIDDNSPESIVNEIELYINLRDNTTLIKSRVNIGAGLARNLGIQASTGKWLLFADCDDFFNPCLSKVLQELSRLCDVDLVYYNTDSRLSTNLEKIKSRGHYYNILINSSIDKNIIDEKILFSIKPPWGKAFCAKFVKSNNIAFDEVFAANDVMFSLKCALKAKTILLNRNVLYCATSSANSIQKTTNKLFQYSRFNVALDHYIYLKQINNLKYRMNIWKTIFRFKSSISFGDYVNLVKKAKNTMSSKHFVLDLIKMPKEIFLYILRHEL